MPVLNNPLIQRALRLITRLPAEPWGAVAPVLQPMILAGDASRAPFDAVDRFAFYGFRASVPTYTSGVGVQNPEDSGAVVVVDQVWVRVAASTEYYLTVSNTLDTVSNTYAVTNRNMREGVASEELDIPQGIAHIMTGGTNYHGTRMGRMYALNNNLPPNLKDLDVVLEPGSQFWVWTTDADKSLYVSIWGRVYRD